MILNPSVNAYRRLDPHFEAPNEIKVSATDRGSMVRIPLCDEKSARVEVRSVAPDINPYLVVYTILKLGLMGVNATKKEKEVYNKVRQKREKLPGNIYDALRYFKNSKGMKEILGKTNHAKFIEFKEWVANRSPKELGKNIKYWEIVDHHEVRNQMLMEGF